MNVSEYRNLAEQVEKNKQDILKHFQRDEILADFGIRIIGQVDSPEELPETAAEYGDAYAVGTQSPFNYYIWTRANNLSPVDYWFDFGEIAIAGPQGPKGDRGEKGATGESTYWISTFTLDYLDLEEQDIPLATMVLEYSSGNVYQVQIVNGVKMFNYQMNIKGATGARGPQGPKGDTGAQGPRGEKGDTGDVGGFINIAGVVSSYEALPDPEVIGDLTVAYLVGTAEPYELYVQVGSNSRVATWLDVGPLNVATMVTVNGAYQNTWNADTKLDKITTPSGHNMAYIKGFTGTQSMLEISQTPMAWKIASYDGEGNLKTAIPEEATDCVNLEYFNANAGGGWKSIKVTDATQTGSFYLPTELQGHYLNIIITVDYHNFIDWNEKHTVMHGPSAWRVEGKNLPFLAKTLDGFSDDPEVTTPSIELSGAAYGDISFTGAHIWFHAYTGSTMDYYTPEYTLYYQDLGPSFVAYP